MATTLTYAPVVNMTGVATTASSTTITVAASALGSWGVAIGAVLSHANIPVGTTITGFPTATTATLSAAATITGSSLTVVATNPNIINMDQIPKIVKTGGDIYNINGTNLVIDGHSRFDLNSGNVSSTTATSLGNITLSATLGGTLTIDGRKVRMIRYTGGSGTVPTPGTIISQGAASGKLIGVYSTFIVAPLVAGTVPANGWVMIKQWNDVEFGAGVLTGIIATATGPSIVGFIEVMGDEGSTITANRLGTFNVFGEWFKVGVTTGVSSQTMQIPNNGTLKHIAGVYVEKTAGLKDYEFYPNAGTVTLVMSTDIYRGKVCWISNTGVVRLGSDGTNVIGYLPPVGLEVVVPNVFLCNCVTTDRIYVAIPNATLATRYDFTTTGGGVINIDKANVEWYGSFSQPYSVQLTNSGFIDAINISECATECNWTNVGVGNKPTTALLVQPLTMGLMFAGGTFTDCVWSRVSQASSGAHTIGLTDIVGFNFIRNTIRANTIRANATTYSINGTRMVDCYFEDTKIIQGSMTLITCNNIKVKNTIYMDSVSATTVTTYAMYIWNLSSNTLNCTFEGLTMPVTNCQPYTALLSIGSAGCANIKLRNIGTRAAPLSLGSTNSTALIYVLGVGAAASDIKIQRVYCATTRTGIMTGDNSSTRVVMENVFGDYADATDVGAVLNYDRKGIGSTLALTAQTAVYGTHWLDYFTSTTAGRLAVLMNEPTSATSGQVTLGSGAAFTSAGGLYMPVIGMNAMFETPYYVLGHTQFANSALVMAGGTATNYTYNYQIDKNDGNGWSTLSADYTATTLGTALNGLGALDASKGFKLRLKIRTTTTNATAITSVYMTTVSSTAAQDYQYPLDTITLSLAGLVDGSDVVILSSGTETVLDTKEDNGGTAYAYTYETPQTVDIRVYKPGYFPFAIVNYALGSTNASLPIVQVPDVSYLD